MTTDYKLAWHGEPLLKEKALERLADDRKLDRLTQGTYWCQDESMGCAIGCLSRCSQDAHSVTARLFGFPLPVTHWLDRTFESQAEFLAGWWATESVAAIPVGADLTPCCHELLAWLLGPDSPFAEGNQNTLCRSAVITARKLNLRAVEGDVACIDVWGRGWRLANAKVESIKRLAKVARAPLIEVGQAEISASVAAWSCRLGMHPADPILQDCRAVAGAISSSILGAGLTAQKDADPEAWNCYGAAENINGRRHAAHEIAKKSIEIFKNAPVASSEVAEHEADYSLRHLERVAKGQQRLSKI